MTYVANVNNRPVTNFVFVKPGDMLSYVLSIGSADERFKPDMARRVFQSLQITL